jgi:hypothetical protein
MIDRKMPFGILRGMEKLSIKQEVALLRSAVIGLIAENDPEGEYRPAFVEEMFRTLAEEPEFTFTTGGQFLKHLNTYKKK